MSVKVLLIGLDGATFSILDPLMAQGNMPFLQKFLARGVRAGLRTIIPPLTPPAWTSLMTGRSPGYHGVFDFFRMESSESRLIRFSTSHDVRCETIWSMASRNELKVTALNFPSMFPAPKLSGYVIPGWVPWRQLRLACAPPNLFDRLKSLSWFNARELAMDIKLEEKATEGCENHEYENWVQLHTRREENWYEIFRYLTSEDPSELTAVLFDGVDKLQHLCWRFIDPAYAHSLKADWEFRVRDLCLEYFRRLDQILEQMCSLVGPEANIFIASDHGFGPTAEVFNLNAWLEQHGYLAWSKTALDTESKTGALLGVGQVARHTYLLDWEKTTAFAATPTSNGIYVVVNENGNSGGIRPSEYQSFREKLRRELAEVHSPVTGKPVIESIWTRDEVFSGPCMSLAPDLTLYLRDGGLISILPSNQTMSPRPAVAGSHRPVGVFAASGPGIRSGNRISELSILDVAPMALYSLGLPIPEDLEGTVPEMVFDSQVLRERPVRTEAPGAALTANESAAAPVIAPEDEAVIMDRLRDLGYVE